MPIRSYSVVRTTRASASGVLGLLRLHPQTAMTAILALAYPAPTTSGSFVTELIVGNAMPSSEGAVSLSLEWCLDCGANGITGFSGQLFVTPTDHGVRLEIRGVVRGDAISGEEVEFDTLSRVLSNLAAATESGPSAEGT